MSRLLAGWLALATLAAAGCSSPAPPEPPPSVAGDHPTTRSPAARADEPKPDPARTPGQALAAGVAFLVKQQSPDGAWRSDVYATFKDGPALTPLVVCALQDAAAGTPAPDTAAARRKGSVYLAKLVTTDGSIAGGESGLDYPVYTAALAIKALSHPENKDLLTARDAWLKYLLDRQLAEQLGWAPGDKPYGGWGYCRLLPKKPEPGALAPPLVESNLSATVFALDALRAAGVADKGVYEKAAGFVGRCQNYYPSLGCSLAPPHLDGGFHFIYDDPVRNKAGAGEQPPGEPARFRSYGSTTADGLRALILCGGPEPDRVLAARWWLQTNFRPDSHPGAYIAAHERNRAAVYYYYAASVARAFRAADVREADGKPWAGPLATELARRQAADGSWANPVELVRENDPLVATGNAVTALANCRAAPAAK